MDQINKNRRILIVDDEPYNILGLKVVLQQSGIKNLI
jgi:CheY-like chemotaxis protein